MRKLYTILIALLLTTTLLAQSPEKMSYQAVIRNSSDALVTNTQVAMQISILQASAIGTAVYVETQTPTTNVNGLITIEIGTGTTTDDFSTIDWANGSYFIKTETDPAGGTNYTITGTSQLLSVPYALHAKTAESVTGIISETDPVYTASQAVNIIASDITNLGNLSGTNTGDQDILGIATNASSISTIHTQQTAQDVAIALNTAKTGITIEQSDAIIANTGKDTTGIYHANRVALNLVSGINTGDEDLAPYATKDMENTKIINLANPTADHDAATKAYVDALHLQIRILEDNLIDAGMYVLKDIEGNAYDVVKIADQVWMAENLKTTKYNDGTDIPLVEDGAEWSNLTSPAYCWYNNDEASFKNPYGVLYNWYTVETGNLCPTDWHVPTDVEWSILIDFLGGESVAGGKIKEIGTAHWNTPNEGATNEIGFTALPGGFREFSFGQFKSIGYLGTLWSATESSSGNAWMLSVDYIRINTTRYGYDNKRGLSVRCVRD
ncbi:MAG: fibrobacter succinogenes major paralogous domain-containing protein [Bacteroidetes bacterium]|nr:fibrobacter succinogenes major paralogous domain-containing protein [Bacteroidota bacterium]